MKTWEEIFRELHPVVIDEVKITDSAKRILAPRRKEDKRLWDGLDGEGSPLGRAAQEIERAIASIVGHMGMGKTTLSNLLLRVRNAVGSEHEQDWYVQRLQTYKQWATDLCKDEDGCAAYGIIYEIFINGKGITHVSKENRMRKEKLWELMRYGLNEYCLIRGWGDQLDRTK